MQEDALLLGAVARWSWEHQVNDRHHGFNPRFEGLVRRLECPRYDNDDPGAWIELMVAIGIFGDVFRHAVAPSKNDDGRWLVCRGTPGLLLPIAKIYPVSYRAEAGKWQWLRSHCGRCELWSDRDWQGGGRIPSTSVLVAQDAICTRCSLLCAI